MDWLIAETRGSKILLVAKEPVAYMSFSDKDKPVTWKDCKIRKWLNGEFLNRFTEAEKKRINKTEVVTYPTGLYGDESETYTHDYVFLLEEKEAEEYYDCDVDRIALDENRQFIEWWLRPFGKTGDVTCYVDKNGWVCSGGTVKNNKGGSCSYNGTADRTKKFAIIPAMWIDKKNGKEIATYKWSLFGEAEVKKDTIEFGIWDSEEYRTTRLKWKILDKQKDKMLVITKHVLAELPFNNKLKSVCRLDGNRINLAEKQVYQRQILELKFKRTLGVALKESVNDKVSIHRCQMRKYRDNALAAERHNRNNLVIVAGINR